jgi:peptidoglycan-N-acetylglucosamine deacetylase
MLKMALFPILFCTAALFVFGAPQQEKIIALTFDDGPRPYVLYGEKGEPGLLNLLDHYQIRATFFAIGFRLTEHRPPNDHNVGISPYQAAQELYRRGHEIENHTFSHVWFSKLHATKGDAYILDDIDKASLLIRGITGSQPSFVRPPSWILWPSLRDMIERRGYRMCVKAFNGVKEPLVTQDVDSEDYFCLKDADKKCPEHSLAMSMIHKIERREKLGISAHILVFHELPSSVNALEKIIPELQKRGYKFVLLRELTQQTQGRKQ